MGNKQAIISEAGSELFLVHEALAVRGEPSVYVKVAEKDALKGSVNLMHTHVCEQQPAGELVLGHVACAVADRKLGQRVQSAAPFNVYSIGLQ